MHQDTNGLEKLTPNLLNPCRNVKQNDRLPLNNDSNYSAGYRSRLARDTVTTCSASRSRFACRDQGSPSLVSLFGRAQRHWRFALFDLTHIRSTEDFQRCALLATLESPEFNLPANPFGREKCPVDISLHPPRPWPPTVLPGGFHTRILDIAE